LKFRGVNQIGTTKIIKNIREGALRPLLEAVLHYFLRSKIGRKNNTVPIIAKIKE
jgi:hypothetical protein